MTEMVLAAAAASRIEESRAKRSPGLEAYPGLPTVNLSARAASMALPAVFRQGICSVVKNTLSWRWTVSSTVLPRYADMAWLNSDRSRTGR